MFAPHSTRLRRRLSAPTSGSARRRARERQLAEKTRAEGERIARQQREQRLREIYEQQRQDWQELATYAPWGRAGGGAPNPRGVRFTDLRSKGIYPEDELKGVSIFEACRSWHSPRRRQRRTPVRLREDPQLCYADSLRQAVDNDIRYRQTPYEQQSYKQFLDDMVDKRNKAMKDEMKRNLEYERQIHAMEGPWGKPGPGGTTWRNPRDVGLNFSKSMGWTDNETFNKIRGDNKKSSLTLPRVKRDDDTEYDADKENKSSSVEKLPDIAQTSNDKKQSSSSDEKVKSNGRSKRTPKKSKFVKRLSNGERVKRMVVEREEGEVEESVGNVGEKKPTPEAAILRVTGGVELVPLLARRRRVGARTLPSSDVTRPPEQACQWREILNMDYLRQLKHQMRVKYEQKEESRLDSAESVRRHHATWASLWGRPGHGAPQRGRYARNNLAELLYRSPIPNAPL